MGSRFFHEDGESKLHIADFSDVDCITIQIDNKTSIAEMRRSFEAGEHDYVKAVYFAVETSSFRVWWQLKPLIKLVTNLPNLKVVVLRNGNAKMKPWARRMLLRETSLRKIVFDGFMKSPSSLSLKDLKNHTELETLEIHFRYHLRYRGVLWDIDSLHPEIFQLPSLKRLVITTCFVPSEFVLQLFCSPVGPLLEDVRLKASRSWQDSFLKVAPLIKVHKHLHTLHLGVIELMSAESRSRFVHMLAENHSLKDLEFRPLLFGVQLVQRARPTQIRNALIEPPLNVSVRAATTAFLVEDIPKALRQNRTLRKLHIVNRPSRTISFEVQAAWLKLIKENNYILEEMTLMVGNQDCKFFADQYLQHSLEFYLRLNKYGMRPGLASTKMTRESLVGVLSQSEACNDVSCIYYFLQQYPDLVSDRG